MPCSCICNVFVKLPQLSIGARMKCEPMWHQQSTSGVVPVPPAEVPSLMGLDWLFEHTDSEPDDAPCSNPGEFLYTMALLV